MKVFPQWVLLIFGWIPQLLYGQTTDSLSLELPRFSLTEMNAVKKQGYPILSSLPQHYVKDGSVDYTHEIQMALDQHRWVVFPPFPILINDSGLHLHSHQRIYFSRGSQLILKPSHQQGYAVLLLQDITDVKLYYPTIIGDRYTHQGTTGEWGMGISIRGSSNILIYQPDVRNCWGDGIYIGDAQQPYCTYIHIVGGYIAQNRRNGISIIGADSLMIDSTILVQNTGTWPKGGIDIEPNRPENIIDHIVLNQLFTKQNYAGIIISLNALNQSKHLVTPYICINRPIDSASTYGMMIVQILPHSNYSTRVEGNIEVIHPLWIDNTGAPLYGKEYLQNNIGPTITLYAPQAYLHHKPLTNNEILSPTLTHQATLESKIKIIQ